MIIDIPDNVALALLKALIRANPGSQQNPADRILSTKADLLLLPEGDRNAERATNVLRTAMDHLFEIWSIEDLCRLREQDFLKIRNCGKKTLHCVRKGLAAIGLEFGMTDNDFLAFRQGTFKPKG